MAGGAGNDVLKGMAGNDTINGGSGADAMHGGDGADIYYVDNSGDQVVELVSQGTDTIRTGFTHTLGANVENLEILYSGNAWATGNALDNRIIGNAGNNVIKGLTGNDALNGAAGNDTIDGGLGADSMYGGDGDDIFIVDDTGDLVVEIVGQGIDTVRTSLAHTLAAIVENLELVSAGNVAGTPIHVAPASQQQRGFLVGLEMHKQLRFVPQLQGALLIVGHRRRSCFDQMSIIRIYAQSEMPVKLKAEDAIWGAYTDPPEGIKLNERRRLDFVAKQAGKYFLACARQTHLMDGHWICFEVGDGLEQAVAR